MGVQDRFQFFSSLPNIGLHPTAGVGRVAPAAGEAGRQGALPPAPRMRPLCLARGGRTCRRAAILRASVKGIDSARCPPTVGPRAVHFRVSEPFANPSFLTRCPYQERLDEPKGPPRPSSSRRNAPTSDARRKDPAFWLSGPLADR